MAIIVRWAKRQAIALGQPPAETLREAWEHEADGCTECRAALTDLSVDVALQLPDPLVDDVDRFVSALERWERLAYVALKAAHDSDIVGVPPSRGRRK